MFHRFEVLALFACFAVSFNFSLVKIKIAQRVLHLKAKIKFLRKTHGIIRMNLTGPYLISVRTIQ